MPCWCFIYRTIFGRSLLASFMLHLGLIGTGVGFSYWYVAPNLKMGHGMPGSPKGGMGFQYLPWPEHQGISPLVSVSPHTAQMANDVYVDKLTTEVAPDQVQLGPPNEADPVATVANPAAPPRPSVAPKSSQLSVAQGAAKLGRAAALNQPQVAGLIVAALPAERLVGAQGKGNGNGLDLGDGTGNGGDGGDGPDFSGNRPPRYPDIAQTNRWEGTVLLRLHVSAQGAVTEVEVARSSGYSVLDAAAVSAARSWRGQPARRGGVPVASVEVQEIWFHLK